MRQLYRQSRSAFEIIIPFRGLLCEVFTLHLFSLLFSYENHLKREFMRYAFKRLFSGSFYFSLRSILKLILGGKLYGASGCLGRYRRRFDTGPWRFSFLQAGGLLAPYRTVEILPRRRALRPLPHQHQIRRYLFYGGGGFHCPFAFSPAVAPILLYAQDRN